MAITVRKASADDVRPLALALARAFVDDPVMRWLLPADTSRTRRLRQLFGTQMRHHYLADDEVYTTREVDAAALWSAPERWRTPRASLLWALPAVLWTLRDHVPAAVRAVRAIERVHPEEPHWYLAVVGVDPRRQRLGIGSALLAPIVERCDRDFVAAYLESSREDNLAFYHRLGFEVAGRIDLPGGGPPVWPMWRAPRP